MFLNLHIEYPRVQLHVHVYMYCTPVLTVTDSLTPLLFDTIALSERRAREREERLHDIYCLLGSYKVAVYCELLIFTFPGLRSPMAAGWLSAIFS